MYAAYIIDNMMHVTPSFMGYERTFFPGNIEVRFTRTSEDHDQT